MPRSRNQSRTLKPQDVGALHDEDILLPSGGRNKPQIRVEHTADSEDVHKLAHTLDSDQLGVLTYDAPPDNDGKKQHQ